MNCCLHDAIGKGVAPGGGGGRVFWGGGGKGGFGIPRIENMGGRRND